MSKALLLQKLLREQEQLKILVMENQALDIITEFELFHLSSDANTVQTHNTIKQYQGTIARSQTTLIRSYSPMIEDMQHGDMVYLQKSLMKKKRYPRSLRWAQARRKHKIHRKPSVIKCFDDHHKVNTDYVTKCLHLGTCISHGTPEINITKDSMDLIAQIEALRAENQKQKELLNLRERVRKHREKNK